MIATWMISTTMLFLAAALAAAIVERGMQAVPTLPRRFIWLAALCAASLLATRPWWPAPVSEGRSLLASPVGTVAAPMTGSSNLSQIDPRATIEFARDWSWPSVSPGVETAARVGWWISSATMSLLLVVSIVRLRRERASWTRSSLHGVPVMTSPSFGPAIIGLVQPIVVVPQWVHELPAAQQRMVLAHEVEHREARDVWILASMLVALVVMPWNLGLWLIRQRLRRSVELDCDARVIARGVEPALYAQVLLSAWQRAEERQGWGPVPALAERASELGRRVEHLMRPMPRRSLMRTALSICMAAIVMGATRVIPAPVMASTTRVVPQQMAKSASFQPPRPPRVLVVAPFDSAHNAYANAIGVAVAADSAAGRVRVISRQDQEETLRASGFSGTTALGEKDINSLSRLLRADYVIRLKVVDNGSRVETSGGTPAAGQEPIVLRRLVDVTVPANRAGPPPAAISNVLLQALKADSIYQHVRAPASKRSN